MEQKNIFVAKEEAEADDVKKKIKDLWLATGLVGADKLLAWLEETDFFLAPCSRDKHLAVPGGLALHSLYVYNLLADKMRRYFEQLRIAEQRTGIICGLGHDLCKVNYYREGERWRKDEAGRWESYRTYEIEDAEPLGHGEKSVMILQRFIELTRDEMLAIRWHMGAFDPLIHTYQGGLTYSAAQKASPLVTLLHTADLEATQILERMVIENRRSSKG